MLHTSDSGMNTVYVINIEFKITTLLSIGCFMLYVTIQVQQTFLSLKANDTKHFKFFNTDPGYIL
jgi:hypothetical protein